MTAAIPGLLIEFTVQTVFLLAALWILIKLQKLNYHFLGLLGAAALSSAIDLLPLPFHVQDFISCSVLLLCITKVTRSDYTDVLFTVGVGYALTFGMNLWLLGAMMGDLRPSAREAETKQLTEALVRLDHERERHQATAQPKTAVAPSAKPKSAPGQPAPPEPAPEPAVPVVKSKAAPSLQTPIPYLAVKALTRNGTQSSVTLQSGQRSCTLFLGDSGVLQTAAGEREVHFTELTSQWIRLTVDGQPVQLGVP